MKVIYKRTLEETLKLTTLVFVLLAGILGGFILKGGSTLNEIPAYVNYLNDCLIKQHLVVFFLINGVSLLTVAAAVSSGLIASEVHEGTFRILVAKPNSRITILVSKVCGMWTGLMILMLLGLSAMYAAELFLGSWDGNIAKELLSYFPAYLLYGLIIALFITSFGTLLSSIMKKRMMALLPLLLVIILILALPIIMRIVIMISGNGGGSRQILNLVDLNYHFGLLFKWCCDLFGGLNGTSQQLEPLSILMNLFTTARVDADLVRTTSWESLTIANNSLPVIGVLLFYVMLSIINYVSSLLIINNKDV